MQNVAFALIGGGGLIGIGYFLFWFFSASDIDLGFRIAVGAIVVGVLVLFGVVVRQRIRATEDEDFKEVKY